MSDFCVEALSNYWDHSGFVKNYGMYLDQKLELITFERKLTPVGFRDDHGPAGRAKSSKMVLVALYRVLRESFRIYADICEALGVLLDRFTEMEYGNCVKTFDQYVIAAKRIDELVDFYSWSKELGVARARVPRGATGYR
ncbi:putative ANTH domain-containing protein [Helianthus debilis subsp. tardiflorus]